MSDLTWLSSSVAEFLANLGDSARQVLVFRQTVVQCGRYSHPQTLADALNGCLNAVFVVQRVLYELGIGRREVPCTRI